jgi:hypothetical protein
MGVAIFERALEDRDARLLPRGSLLDPQNGPILGVILDNYNLGLG